MLQTEVNRPFHLHEGNETRVIDYKVEGIDIDEAGVVRNFSISLLCPVRSSEILKCFRIYGKLDGAF